MFVAEPLSLANDKQLNGGKIRVGIVAPASSRERKVKLFTSASVLPGEYKVGVVAYVYDEDGAIAERIEHSMPISCEA